MNFRFAASFYRHYLGYYAPLLTPLPPLLVLRETIARVDRIWNTFDIGVDLCLESIPWSIRLSLSCTLVVISNRGKKAMEIVLQITFTRYSFLSRGKIKIERKKKNQIFHFVSWD